MILVIVFLLGLAGLAWLVVQNAQNTTNYNNTVAAIKQTNDQVQTAIAATQTAKSWTFTPSPTPIPTDTPTFTPTETFTPSPSITPSPTIDDQDDQYQGGNRRDQMLEHQGWTDEAVWRVGGVQRLIRNTPVHTPPHCVMEGRDRYQRQNDQRGRQYTCTFPLVFSSLRSSGVQP